MACGTARSRGGRALALLHTELARPWTAEELARQVYLSRSAFADRFTALIGAAAHHLPDALANAGGGATLA